MLPLLLTDLHLTFARSPWMFVLLALAATALAFLVYRYTLPPVGRGRRALLWGLRGLALMLILLMLFEPVLNYILNKRERPTVALLLDESASMGPAVENGRRAAAVNDFLKSSAFSELKRRADVRLFAFADSIQEVAADSQGMLEPTGTSTDMAFGWERATRVLAATNLSAVIVASDGANNSGASPERAAGESRLPLFTLGVGDTTEYPDAAVIELLTNDVAYAGSRVPVDVRLRGSGLEDKSAHFRLVDARGQALADETVRFTASSGDVIVHAFYEAEAVGEYRLTAILDSIPGEVTAENNRRSVIINVLDNRAKVIILSGPPTADLTALRQTLEKDSTLETFTSVELGQGKVVRGSPEIDADLFEKAKLVVLINYPSEFTPSGQVRVVANALESGRIPVLFHVGPQSDLSALQSFEAVTPLRTGKPVVQSERVVLRESQSHPAISGSSPLPADWATLPPVMAKVGNVTVTPSAQVVAKLSREALGIQENEAAVALWEVGQRRGAAILIWNSSQWKLQLAANSTAGGYYDQFFGRLVRWLIAPADEKRVVVRTTKKLYSGGEKVRFTAQVYGADLQPRDDAVFDLSVNSEGRNEKVPLKGRGNGRYDGEMLSWGNGEYIFRASALTGSDTLGKDDGKFVVEAFNPELLNSRSRFDLLRTVAEKSGGKFAPIERAGDLVNNVNLEARTVSRKREVPLWNQATMLWLIIALLAAEWTVRKRSGML